MPGLYFDETPKQPHYPSQAATRRNLLKPKLMLPHGLKDLRPRLRLAKTLFDKLMEPSPVDLHPAEGFGLKALRPRLRLASPKLKEPSPSQHSFHMFSALSLFSRISRSILQKMAATNILLLNLLFAHATRCLKSALGRAASFKNSIARYAVQHCRVATKMSVQTSRKMTPCIPSYAGESFAVSFWRAW